MAVDHGEAGISRRNLLGAGFKIGVTTAIFPHSALADIPVSTTSACTVPLVPEQVFAQRRAELEQRIRVVQRSPHAGVFYYIPPDTHTRSINRALIPTLGSEGFGWVTQSESFVVAGSRWLSRNGNFSVEQAAYPYNNSMNEETFERLLERVPEGQGKIYSFIGYRDLIGSSMYSNDEGVVSALLYGGGPSVDYNLPDTRFVQFFSHFNGMWYQQPIASTDGVITYGMSGARNATYLAFHMTNPGLLPSHKPLRADQFAVFITDENGVLIQKALKEEPHTLRTTPTSPIDDVRVYQSVTNFGLDAVMS